MRIPLSSVTVAHLRDADQIDAIDSNRPEFHDRLWRAPLVFRAPNSSPTLLRAVEVFLDSRDEGHIQRLRQMVREAKSR